MKKTIVVLLLFCLLAFSSGCSTRSSPEATPEATVERFLSAIQSFDFDAVVDEIVPDDVGFAGSWEELLANTHDDPYSVFFLDYYRENAAKVQYNPLLPVSIDGNEGRLIVAVGFLDGAPLMRESLAQLEKEKSELESSGVDLSEAEVLKILDRIIVEKRTSIEEELQLRYLMFVLELKEDKWYITDVEALLKVIVFSGPNEW